MRLRLQRRRLPSWRRSHFPSPLHFTASRLGGCLARLLRGLGWLLVPLRDSLLPCSPFFPVRAFRPPSTGPPCRLLCGTLTGVGEGTDEGGGVTAGREAPDWPPTVPLLSSLCCLANVAFSCLICFLFSFQSCLDLALWFCRLALSSREDSITLESTEGRIGSWAGEDDAIICWIWRSCSWGDIVEVWGDCFCCCCCC